MSQARWARAAAYAGRAPNSPQAKRYQRQCEFASLVVEHSPKSEQGRVRRHFNLSQRYGSKVLEDKTVAYTCSLYCAALQMSLDMTADLEQVAEMLRANVGDVIPIGMGTAEITSVHRVEPVRVCDLTRNVTCGVCGTAIEKYAVPEP